MSPFAFQNPSLLALLLTLIPVGWLMLRARKRREIVRRQMGGSTNKPSSLRDGLRLFALLLLLLAVARPGVFPRRHSVTQSGRDVVFALDVSQSMLAKDAFPSRLEAAKNGIRDALDSFRSERVALVVYAGSANILCPLTHDYEFVRYMLDQATPRAVDFGGTTLLSATEKSVDNVFDSERKGMQDLVVLTDGEEHGDQNKRVAKLLQENETGLLIIGIGDSTVGSRIPIESDDGESDDGEPDVLKHDGHVVMTKLNETGLQQLARMSTDATYVSAGTSAFDLAGTYAQYAINKPIAGIAGGETYVVYREVGLLLIGIAIAMLLAAEIAGHLSGKHFSTREPTSNPSPSLLLIALLSTIGWNTVNAEDTSLTSQFETAARLQNSGKTSEALEAFDAIESQWLASSLTPTQLATIRFNQGLCHVSLAQEQAEAEPRQALSRAQIAQNCFLEACRMNPRFVRAAMRLDPTASLIENYIQLIEEEDEREQQLQEQMQNLLKLLKELEEKQTELRNEIPGRPNQNTRSRRGQSGVEPPPSAPDSASSDAKRFTQTQRSLHDEGSSIRQIMRSIDQSISLQNEAPLSDSEVNDSSQPQVSVLEEPLRLMDQVVDAQEQAIGKLQQWNSWPAGRDQQLVAIKKIQEILEMLSSNDSGESDEGEWDEDAEYDEMMEASDSEEAMMSSMQGQGDFASGSSMQPLPVPNYSVEDILMEEQGSLQFRQQQRAKSNQANVEKDW